MASPSSPGEKYLYVHNTEPKKLWMRYTVRPDGTLADPKLLFDDTSDTRLGAPDGMKVDSEGNIYSAGPSGVWIISPRQAAGDDRDAGARVQCSLGWTRPKDPLHCGQHQHLSRYSRHSGRTDRAEQIGARIFAGVITLCAIASYSSTVNARIGVDRSER